MGAFGDFWIRFVSYVPDDPGNASGEFFVMQNAVNTLMLVCATMASLAFGVLAAYWVCRVAFAGLRVHAGQVAAERAKAQISPISQA